MKKTLITVGNSKALIIPAELIKKYGLDVIEIKETEKGLLITPLERTDEFQEELKRLRRYKEEIYDKMAFEANEKEIQTYYNNPDNDISDIDLDIIE
ncbi:MAG: toxin-antitoxin system MazE family antidote component [Algoriphagus marincola HL-49]|uniref:Toxin-antitoxin system MazE family antidote component n=1 Tax=Algoriphagus marincola HL-49 TaxID=1305737 RepID=A0A0N8KFB4_9BACT|nr:MAG: toxin-antitoxin system MazE family antidote component [Algoriphagus marincola HL-49]